MRERSAFASFSAFAAASSSSLIFTPSSVLRCDNVATRTMLKSVSSTTTAAAAVSAMWTARSL
jgi:hypothetical protein